MDTRTVCITADGVLLRFLVNGQIVSEARSVNYSPQSADLFHAPSGLRAVTGARRRARAVTLMPPTRDGATSAD